MIKQTHLSFIGVVILSLSLVAVCGAQEVDRKKNAEEMKKMVQKAKDKLNNTTWQIELRRMATDKKKREETDTLRFEDYKIESDKLISEGFTPTNYTVRLKGEENDIIVWETMQTSEKKGVAFWRGEIKDDIMRGVLSWHLSETDKKDYTFVSVKKEGIAGAIKETVPAVQEIKEPVKKPVETKTEGKPAEVKTEEVEEPGGRKAMEEEGEKNRRRWFW